MLYPLSTELYPTLLRTLGFGWCSGIGRIGAALIPYLIFPLLEVDVYSSFLVFSLCGLIAAIASFRVPYDTRGRYLDFQNENKNY